jgi:hypothetical protein
VRRWIALPAQEGPGSYWCLYEGQLDHSQPRRLVATVCKFVTRWRGYVHAQRSVDGRRELVTAQRSLSQESAGAAARWVVERLEGGA